MVLKESNVMSNVFAYTKSFNALESHHASLCDFNKFEHMVVYNDVNNLEWSS